MLWQRFRIGSILAVPMGVVIGVGVGYVASQTLQGWGSASNFIGAGAVLGGVDAAVATLGAVIAMRIRLDSRGQTTPLVGAGALGAGVGAAAVWIVIGVVVGTSGLLALFLALPIAVICALVAAGIAAAIIHSENRRSLKRHQSHRDKNDPDIRVRSL